MDINKSYLHAPIDEEIYLEQPEGFEVTSKTNEKLVCKLKKSLYGLKQSGTTIFNEMISRKIILIFVCTENIEQLWLSFGWMIW